MPKAGWTARVVPWIRVGFGVVGVAVLGLLIRSVGVKALFAAIVPAAKWLPVVALLEGTHIATDTLVTWAAYGPSAHLVPKGVLFRAHLVGYAVSSIAPAGRAAAEATKAAMLAPWAGGAAATAVATTNQAVTLFGAGLISFPCALAAYAATGFSLVTIFLLVHGVVAFSLGVGLRLGTRARSVGAWIGAKFHRLRHHTEAFHDTARGVSVVPLVPVLAALAGRLVQVLQYGLLAYALGARLTVVRAFLAQGINQIALAVGIFVPGQVGASEGVFTLASDALGMTAATALSIALLAHVVQTFWILVGTITPLVWRPKLPDAPPPR